MLAEKYVTKILCVYKRTIRVYNIAVRNCNFYADVTHAS